MTKRRTVFQPDREQEFEDAELAMLEREGLLVPLEEPKPEPQPTPEPQPAATATAAVIVAPAPKEASTDGSKQEQR